VGWFVVGPLGRSVVFRVAWGGVRREHGRIPRVTRQARVSRRRNCLGLRDVRSTENPLNAFAVFQTMILLLPWACSSLRTCAVATTGVPSRSPEASHVHENPGSSPPRSSAPACDCPCRPGRSTSGPGVDGPTPTITLSAVAVSVTSLVGVAAGTSSCWCSMTEHAIADYQVVAVFRAPGRVCGSGWKPSVPKKSIALG